MTSSTSCSELISSGGVDIDLDDDDFHFDHHDDDWDDDDAEEDEQKYEGLKKISPNHKEKHKEKE